MGLLSPRTASAVLSSVLLASACAQGGRIARPSGADETPVFATTPSLAPSTPSARPVPTATVARAATATSSAGPRATATVRGSSAPLAPPTGSAPSQVRYYFAPRPAASGPTPSALLTVADLAAAPGRRIIVDVTQDRPGAVYMNGFAATAGFPMGALRACVQPAAGPTCTPVAVPDPGYWAVTATDVAHSTRYQLVVTVAQSSTALLGLHVGWEGPHRATVGNLALPGGCTTTSGYRPGCGVRAHVDLGAGGPVTLSSATSGLHVTVKDKTSGAKLASTTLRGSITTTVPAGHEWSMHLLPADGSPVSGVSLTVTWP